MLGKTGSPGGARSEEEEETEETQGPSAEHRKESTGEIVESSSCSSGLEFEQRTSLRLRFGFRSRRERKWGAEQRFRGEAISGSGPGTGARSG